MLAKVIALTCLVASVSCAVPRRQHPVSPSASQILPQAVAAPNEAASKQTHQAKLHYVEIGPSLKGDYKFGYDTGSGPTGQSFREETRLDDGTVKGAYGYVDANGKQRIVKYTAGKNGFVVDNDQEAPGQGASAAQPQPEARARPVAAPQPAPAQAAPASADVFDEPTPINRVNQQQQSQVHADQQHAQQLRQHQLAQQQALAQQQLLAQQQQQQQQLIQQQQQQQQQQLLQQQHQHQAAPQRLAAPAQQQPQFAQPQPQVHQVIDPQNGQYFTSSNDANLNQLLANQLRQLQQGSQFAQQFAQPPPPPAAPQQVQPAPQAAQTVPQAPQHFAAQAAPAFQQPQHFAPHHHHQQQAGLSQPINSPAEFSHQLRQTRQALPNGFQHQQQPAQAHTPQLPASPQAALLALHQQQQHDAQILANLRAQQLAQLQQQQRQQNQQRVAPQEAPVQAAPHQQPAPQASFAPAASAPLPVASQQTAQSQQAALASGPVASAAPVVQPEVFGPPVIDIRTLNYSIGQQTRVN